MQASDFTPEQLLNLGTLAADMLDGLHDGDTIKAHLVLRAEEFKAEPRTVADLDGTDDEASWITPGHVLDAHEVAYLRGLHLA
jgi:hypothetical protein